MLINNMNYRMNNMSYNMNNMNNNINFIMNDLFNNMNIMNNNMNFNNMNFNMNNNMNNMNSNMNFNMNNNHKNNQSNFTNNDNFNVDNDINNGPPPESILETSTISNIDPFENSSNYRKINIIFETGKGRRIPIIAPEDITIEQLFEGFFKKIGILSQEIKKNILFLVNGERINLYEQKSLKENGFKNGIKFIVEFILVYC